MSQLSEQQFDRYRDLIYRSCGIYLNQSKLLMLQAKLDKLLRQNKIDSYDDYYQRLRGEKDQQIWAEFIDEITVHQSGFFRENHHFEYIRSQLRTILEANKRISENGEIRVWSMACATGEEPYTLGMVLTEWLPPQISIRILATDISGRILSVAQNGTYPSSIKKNMDPYYLKHYFNYDGDSYQVKQTIRDLVTFRLFNLIEPFSFKDVFDLIFCRNVMIYFDHYIQQQLIYKIYQVTNLGGFLFLGHSESLINNQYGFKYVQPTIYVKNS